MPLAKQSLQSKLSLVTARRAAAYYDGKSLHQLAQNPGKPEADALKGKRILVVSRACYVEVRDSYPVKSVKELQSMLRQRAAAQSDLKTLHFIGPWQESKRNVLTIRFNTGHAEVLSKAWLVIPETILISRILGGGFKEIESSNAKLFFYQHNSRKSGLFDYQAALRGGVIQTADSARLAFGISEQAKVQSLPWPIYRDILSTGLLSLPWSDIRQFLITRKHNRQPLPITQIGVCAIVLVGGYLAATSLYLSWLEDRRMAQLDAYGGEVAERLSERSQRENEMSRIQALVEQGVDPELVLASFDLLARLQLDGVTLNDFSGNFEMVEVRGEVRSATELVTQLNQMPQIQNIEFTAPVRRGQNGEMFSLSVELRENWRNNNLESAIPVDEPAIVPAHESDLEVEEEID